MQKKCYRSAFRSLLKCNPHCEPSYGTAEQNKLWISKGDILSKKNIINLPDELEGKVINEPKIFETGKPIEMLIGYQKKNNPTAEESKKKIQSQKWNFDLDTMSALTEWVNLHFCNLPQSAKNQKELGYFWKWPDKIRHFFTEEQKKWQ